MAKLTVQQKVIDRLVELGWSEVASRSRKYRTFRKEEKQPFFVFVGKKGALRKGKTVTDSMSFDADKILFGRPEIVSRVF